MMDVTRTQLLEVLDRDTQYLLRSLRSPQVAADHLLVELDGKRMAAQDHVRAGDTEAARRALDEIVALVLAARTALDAMDRARKGQST